jgi:hypothetical protein
MASNYSKEDFQILFNPNTEVLIEAHELDVGYDNTSEVYLVKTRQGQEYIIKIQKNPDMNRTQFWKGLSLLFKKTIVDSIHSQKGLAEFLNQLKGIPVPTVLNYDTTCNNVVHKPYVIMSKLEGKSVRPESEEALELAQNKDIAYQLGCFLSKVHAQSFDYFGNLSGEGLAVAEFGQTLASVIKILGSSNKASRDPKLQAVLPHYIALATAHPVLNNMSMIMLDLWPIQFLLGKNRITGMIDLESYVIGPIGLELTFLEFWVGNLQIFKEGYMAEGAPWPDFEAQRELYRFFLYLLYDCPAMGLEASLEWKAKFQP